MEVKAPSSNTSASQEQLMYKNRLQEYTQKAAIALPLYSTAIEGQAHAPRFRSSVVVDGITYTSDFNFVRKKDAEQDAARVALEAISWKIEPEGVSTIQKDITFCKSILFEYAIKMNLEKPTYTTSQAEALLPTFSSSALFNGQTYVGGTARNKKEAEQLAASAVIQSILASDTKSIMGGIIKSKGKLYSVFDKSGSSSVLLPDCNVALSSHIRESSKDSVEGKEALPNLTNKKLPEHACSGYGQLNGAAMTEPFAPKAEHYYEGYNTELSYGTNNSGSSHSALPQGVSVAAMTSNALNLSSGSPALNNESINRMKMILPLNGRGDAPHIGAVCDNVKRQADKIVGGNESKKARSVEQMQTPSSVGSHSLPQNA